jgi:murein DD-endopeptidase MepM/ murein hydrolase activator NlpD
VPAGESSAAAASSESTTSLVEGVDLSSSPALPPDVAAVETRPADEPGRWIWPVHGEISGFFDSSHRAIDIVAEPGALIWAADGGEVVYAKWEISGYGYLVIVDHGDDYRSYYAHLYGFYVDVGQQVERGDLLGQLGTTGRSSGPHLHFEIRYKGIPRDPLEMLPEP